MTDYFMPIAELAKLLDVPAHTLRYWEKEFPTVVTPTTGAGGRRFYRNAAVDNITRLKEYLYADGYTIDGVKKLIAQDQFAIQKRNTKTGAGATSAKMPKDIKTAIKLLEQAKDLLG